MIHYKSLHIYVCVCIYIYIYIWRRKWQPTPAFLLGKSHGQRSLAGYNPWDRKESDTTYQLNNNYIYIERVDPWRTWFELHGSTYIWTFFSYHTIMDWLNPWMRNFRNGGTTYVEWARVCAQSCLVLCNPMDCSPLGSSVHETSLERILKWVDISLSRELPDPGTKPASPVSLALTDEFFTTETPGNPTYVKGWL